MHRRNRVGSGTMSIYGGRTFNAPLKSSLTAVGAGSTTPTFSRASVATEFGYSPTAVPGDPLTLLDIDSGEARFRGARRVSSGVWSDTYANGIPIPESTLWGFRSEASRTNSNPNSTCVGAVAGTPGTLPTGWSSGFNVTSPEVVGTGIENGIEYIDIRLNGTTSGTASSIAFNSGTGITAAINDVWSTSAFIKIVGGTTTNISGVSQRLRQNDAGGTSLAFLTTVSSYTPPSSGNLIDARTGAAGTLTAVGVAAINHQVLVSHTNGVAIDITLRIGLPQLELGNVPTTPIRTSATALTRAIDSLKYPSASNASETAGTMYAEGITEWVTTGAVALGRTLVDFARSTSTAQDIYITLSNTNSKASALINAGTTQFSVGATPNNTANTPVKVALAWELNNCIASFNGALSTLDTLATMPNFFTTIYIGNDDNGSPVLNGCVKNVAIYKDRKPTQVVQQLTK